MTEIKQWVKLFLIEGHQVLLTKEGYNDGEDLYEVRLSCLHDGVLFKANFGNPQEEKCDNLFDRYDEKMAEKFFKETFLPLMESA